MRTALAALFCLAAFALAAPPAVSQPTMDQLWPNTDGLDWHYNQHFENLRTTPQIVDNQVRIFFDGVTTAPIGIPAQYLRHQLISGPATASLDADLPADPFLQQLWMARPDLHAKIRQTLDNAPCPQDAPQGQYAALLNGEFAFVKTPSEIAAWRCNLANTRSWQWLVSDLTLGNEFTLQLIPDLASDVFLHGTIAAIEPATVPAGTFVGCVRVDYVIDYGMSECTDTGGNVLGTFRSETRGSVHYAPGVGPVQSNEEFILYVEATGTCAAPEDVGRAFRRASLGLTSATTPARHTTWGRLKATYR